MNLLSLFRRAPEPEPINPARELALIGARKRKEAARRPIRAKTDEMRRELGMKPAKWGR